ncbi:CapA family protein [Enhygromyxa salina]|uniref:Capsule biosynthesis protein CapA n=1 Tax=Enhygromyxa salina TaxID=215803 RepID=A0A2S9YU83_9BACT|nr:CapA family protein [Enhygromyxa salina]PRQ08648.1 Capsule biosynthesis protein CapA [Enhygromyxa salina]
MFRRSFLGLCAALALTLAAGGCIRDNKPDSRRRPGSELQTRVGNNDPRGVDDQPDWDRQARELKQRVDPRMPNELPADARTACEAMLGEAATFYISVEGDPEQRAARMAQMQQTRERDLEGCIRDTSVAAAVCVTLLLKDRDSEFPWLLDQCSRAYPKDEQVGAREVRAPELEFTFVGDVIFGRYREDNRFDAIVEPDKVTEKLPLAGPFAELETQLRSDVLVGNLETPVVEVRPESSPIGSSIRFGGGREDVQGLTDAGFSVMSLANNHYYDLRVEGQLQSPKVLADAGIFAIGASRTEAPLYRVESFETQGWRIGFISVTNRINTPVSTDTPTPDKPQVPYIEAGDMPEKLLPLVEQARAAHDLMIVVVHWGDEYAEQPSGKQQKVAHALIEGGVDMLIGHHPHVLQGIEQHQGGLIAYSLGNFLFENTGGIPRLTGVLRAKWVAGDKPCLGDVVFHPAYVKRSPYPHPTAATGGLGKQVRKRVIDQARGLGGAFVEIEGSEDLRLDSLATCGA